LQSKTPRMAVHGGYSSRGLRWVLMAGFLGIAFIFLAATVDAVRLLGAMRAENKILRDAAVERANHLTSVSSSILLADAYLGDYFVVADPQESRDYLAKARDVWSLMRRDLSNYRSSTLDENILVKQLEDLLDRHWRNLDRTMSSPAGGRVRAESLYNDDVLPLRTSVVEITARLEDIDAKQAASTESEIQNEFERLGATLKTVLSVALGGALILAAGCVLYIFRIERQNAHRYREILKTRQALEQLSARLVDAQETERRAISRELHDQVGQTLNALLVDTANLTKRIHPDDAVSRRYLDNIRTFADSSVNSIRDIALLLRPSMLDDLGLIPALEWQAREVSRRSGIKVKVAAENLADSLPDEVRTCIYRVVQEALQNVCRHSGAKSAVITVRDDGSSLSLSVEDDGRGFDPARTRGLGMLGMEERVRQLGGRFEVRSSPEKGAAIHVTLPVAVAAGA
jgi:signal transduction histidine kinase